MPMSTECTKMVIGNHPNGLNVIELNNNDQVNFYYAPNKDPNPVVNATAVVKIKVNIGGLSQRSRLDPFPEWCQDHECHKDIL